MPSFESDSYGSGVKEIPIGHSRRYGETITPISLPEFLGLKLFGFRPFFRGTEKVETCLANLLK